MIWVQVSIVAGAWVAVGVNVALYQAACKAHAEANDVYDQAEALVVLAARYRDTGTSALADADELIRNARSCIQEWSA